jgi:hypothetical protein
VPTRGSWTVRTNGGDSIYHGLDLKLDRRFSKGLLLRGAYTYSKLIDTASEVFTTTGNSSFPEILNNRAADRGLSAFDRRQRFVLTYIYDIPKLRGDSFAAKGLGYIVNGWMFGGTAAFQTGAPYTVSDGFDNNGDGTASDRPTLFNAGADINQWAFDNRTGGLAPGGPAFCSGPYLLSGLGCQPWLNGTWNQNGTAATTDDTGTAITASNIHWLVPATGFGTLGRNSFTVPGRQDLTFGLQRTINLHSERHQLVVRMEMLNPFNHPNTGNPPSTNLSGISTFFQPGSTRSTGATAPAAPSQTFLNIPLTVVGERDIRFWLKYQF